MRAARTRVSFAPAFSAVACVASVAVGDDLAAARKLFDEGLKLEEANDWAGALVKFRAVAAVRANHIVRFHIALCLEKTGKLVDALSEFSLARVSAEKEGGTDESLTIANATKHIQALRARIPSALVRRPSAASATVTIDGGTVVFGTALPLDPGVHVVEVRAEGHRPFNRQITLLEGVREAVVVDVSLEKAPTVVTLSPSAVETPPPRDRTFAYVVGGVGIVSLATAGVFYGLRVAALSELDGTCDGSRDNCDPGKRALEDRGRTYTLGGNIALAVGALTLGTAITIIVLEPKRAAVVASASSVSLRVAF